MRKPLKQRTIHLPDGTTAKVHQEYEVEPGKMSTAKPTAWQGLVMALVRFLRSICP